MESKTKSGNENSGIDLSGDISCPHFEGEGMKGYFSVEMFCDQLYSFPFLASNEPT